MRHVIEHQTDEDFVGVEVRAQQRGNRGPQCTADSAGDDHGWQQRGAATGAEMQRQCAAADHTEDELPFRAHIPHRRAEANRKPDAHEHERRRLDE